MEPITTVSTLVLAASMIAAPKTIKPQVNKPGVVSVLDWDGISGTIYLEQDVNTHEYFMPSILPSSPTILTESSKPISPKPIPSVSTDPDESAIVSLKERLYTELIAYLPEHPRGDSSIISSEEDVVTAIRLIRSLPAGIPLPSLMRNDDGEIGMYWDDGDVYLDINIEPAGIFSMYSRIRTTGGEGFIDGINIDEIDRKWVLENLSVLKRESMVA